MSSNLYWEPTNRTRQTLPYAMKSALQKRFGGTVTDRDMSDADIGYLQGLSDAGVEGADALIAAIEKHGTVTLTELF